MSELPYVNETIKSEHDHASPATKRVSMYGWDTNNAQKTRIGVNPDGSLVTGLNIGSYDYVAVTYPTTTTESYVFKTGGVSGTTVATVNLTYTDTTKDFLSSAEKI